MTRASWQAIRDEVARRIHAREWRPGQPIPYETDLADEFACSRATVNRALRELAATGILDRRRKGGTRVALHPVRQAVLSIPVIRHEVEATGATWSYSLVRRNTAPADGPVMEAMNLPTGTTLLAITALHRADGCAFVVEERWIDAALPGLDAAPFDRTSPNEWLLEHIPYTRADLEIAAIAAEGPAAGLLDLAPGTPVLQIRRTTWDGDRAVTHVRLTHGPGYSLRAGL